jgi:uncharacterized membrane protein
MNERRWPMVALAAAVVLFTLLFGLLATARYHTLFSYDPRDEAVNNQILFNTAHGRWVFATIKGDMIFHGHFRPIFFPLALPYLVAPGPPAFYFTVALLLGLGAFAAFGLGQSLFRDERLALLAALAWLAFPPVHELALGNFDPETVAATFWLAAFYYFHRRRAGGFWLFALLGVCCKETHAPILALFGVLALLEKRSWRWIVPPLVVGSAWFVICVKWVVPSFYQPFPTVYNRLIGVQSPDFWGDALASWRREPLRLLAQMFKPEARYFFGRLLGSVGAVALLSPWSLLPAASATLLILLHKEPLPVRQAHILAGLAPFLFAATLVGLARLSGWLKRARWFPAAALAAWLAWLSVSAFLPGPFGPHRTYGKEDYLPTTLFDARWYRQDDDARQAWRLIEQIPADAAAMTNERYLLPLSTRERLLEFGNRGSDPEAYAGVSWILLGLTEPKCPTCTYARLTPDALRTAAELLRSSRFVLVDRTDRALLLRQASLPGAALPADERDRAAIELESRAQHPIED